MAGGFVAGFNYMCVPGGCRKKSEVLDPLELVSQEGREELGESPKLTVLFKGSILKVEESFSTLSFRFVLRCGVAM